MEITYRRFVPSEGDALINFLTSDTWPFHSSVVIDRDRIRQWMSDGVYDSEENRTFWIVTGDNVVGLIRLMDLGDETPLFDLRIRSQWRGKGFGGQTLIWITRYLFDEFPRIRRIEGTTRQDNVAMRRTFQRCGYAKEAHYRDAWAGAEGAVHDAVGYAILRRDWEAGTVTTPEWHDEHIVASHDQLTSD
ncbi:GNAT family N-acetyltransferase [Streptomyces sp. NBC_00873]|uniref:GNAT family N-acetyltransferase n=1 Tax=Streptomyces sp. NBC_00873 TaxID=2975852 RepID=UPI003863374E|nr:GNAT family N-acetyltransferase [Streptomyces sp. NBC_00873]